MFNLLVSASLRNRLFVLGAALILVVYGAMTLRNLPVDVFPDLNRPIVTLVTEAEGLAPEEVEQLVTFPLETAMNGMPGVVRVRSVSGVGLSIIYIEFDWGTNIFLNRQQVTERLSVVREQLPRNVNPQMAPITSIMGEIMLIAIASDAATPMEVREVVDWVIRPRLLTIPGVAQVIPIGGEVRQYRVTLNLAQMTNLDVNRTEIETALKQFGANTAGGFVDQHSREYLIRNLGRTTRLQDLESLPVAYRKGVAVRLGQVASIDYRRAGEARRRRLHGQSRRDLDRAEAAQCRHPEAHHRDRGGTCRSEARTAEEHHHRRRPVPSGVVHQGVHRQCPARLGRSARRRGGRAVPVPAELAHDRYFADGHPDLHPHHCDRVSCVWPQHQHDDSRRPRHRHWRARR